METSVSHLRLCKVEQFEDAYAVLTDSAGRRYDVRRETLPPDTRPGDLFHEAGGAFTLDEKATQAQREKDRRIRAKLQESAKSAAKSA